MILIYVLRNSDILSEYNFWIYNKLSIIIINYLCWTQNTGLIYLCIICNIFIYLLKYGLNTKFVICTIVKPKHY